MTVVARHIPFLDGWRGLAICLVLFSHFVAGADLGADYGRLGVDIFFVLSGMLMGDILFKRKVSLPGFYRRRVSRVVPVFVIYVAVVYAAAALSGGTASWPTFLSTLIFLRTYLPSVPDIWHTGLPISHLWSLNVEEHCYLVMGTWAFFTRRTTYAAMALTSAGALALVVQWLYAHHPDTAPPAYALRTEVAAAFVFLSAGYSLAKQRFADRIPSFAPVLAFVVAGFCYYWRAPWWAPGFAAPCLLAFAVNHLDRSPGFILSLLSYKLIRQLGLWSFSVYLWQQPWHEVQDRLPNGVALLGAIVTGVVSFYCIEQPSRTWLNAHWRDKRDASEEVLNVS